ncbi:PLC-like phosphodiesterase [Schizophyllum amplum]|uniref:PLC-like phosphodiesterase n=1 Tax=Schizophyllum amplum TaxID=97359 RepID=A0A550CQD4_9AGAR|nr:PLC-like phosphodiesterase [Auriculariopsis ampla]
MLGLSALLPLLVVPFASAAPKSRATTCNGHAELCDRSYGNVTFMGSHDSFAYSDDPLALARDQEVDIPSQLDLGVRLLQAQSHMNGDDLHFCHTSCILFDGGKVVDYLTVVKTWLDSNTEEVLTLLFTNPEAVSLTDVWKPAFDDSGISDLVYVPPNLPMKQSDWPTLGDMIDSGKRVVVFMDADSDPSQVDFILPEFDMIWETPYGYTDDSFPCSIDRTSNAQSTADHMYMINHSLNLKIGDITISDPGEADTTNGVDSIVAAADKCVSYSEDNTYPSFVLLDFVNLGDAKAAVDKLNGF